MYNIEPKDKAESLFKRHYCDFIDVLGVKKSKELAFKASLFCVREVITQISKMESGDAKDVEYWREVESEINYLKLNFLR